MPGTWRSESPAPPRRPWPSSARNFRRIGSPWSGWGGTLGGGASNGGGPGGGRGGGGRAGADLLGGAITRRRARGQDRGGAPLAEGLLEKLDPATVGPVEHDSRPSAR